MTAPGAHRATPRGPLADGHRPRGSGRVARRAGRHLSQGRSARPASPTGRRRRRPAPPGGTRRRFTRAVVRVDRAERSPASTLETQTTAVGRRQAETGPATETGRGHDRPAGRPVGHTSVTVSLSMLGHPQPAEGDRGSVVWAGRPAKHRRRPKDRPVTRSNAPEGAGCGVVGEPARADSVRSTRREPPAIPHAPWRRRRAACSARTAHAPRRPTTSSRRTSASGAQRCGDAGGPAPEGWAGSVGAPAARAGGGSPVATAVGPTGGRTDEALGGPRTSIGRSPPVAPRAGRAARARARRRGPPGGQLFVEGGHEAVGVGPEGDAGHPGSEQRDCPQRGEGGLERPDPIPAPPPRRGRRCRWSPRRPRTGAGWAGSGASRTGWPRPPTPCRRRGRRRTRRGRPRGRRRPALVAVRFRPRVAQAASLSFMAESTRPKGPRRRASSPTETTAKTTAKKMT